MAIKMRRNEDRYSVCCECGEKRPDVLNMFDIKIAGQIITVCDQCNLELMNKTLHAECYKSHRIKKREDMRIIRKRGFIKSGGFNGQGN